MTPSPPEQRNPYKGGPPRAWIRVRLLAPNGVAEDVDLHADTGCPLPVIIGVTDLRRFARRVAPALPTNYGLMHGGTVRVIIPALGFDRILLTYGSDTAVAAVRQSHPDFAGLVGLPFLRLMEYGGNDTWLWIRLAAATP
jgi:hypothetical protein